MATSPRATPGSGSGRARHVVASLPRPLADQLKVVGWTDGEIRRIARLAGQEAERIVRTSSSLRGAQAKLAAANAEMWAGVKSATTTGMGDAVYESLELNALIDEELMAKAGVSSRYWRASQLATAQQGVESLISRKENGITLSQRVWRQSQAAQKGLNDAINTGLVLGKGPAEIARDVRKYISPNVPGGASYAAMRLGRTEVLNAYHQTSVRKYQQTPWIGSVEWRLSGSHPRPDECNEYEGGGDRPDGTWSPGEVPGKPHPNCLCYIEPVLMDFNEYAKRFDNGEFDEYIDEQMGCARV